MNTILIGICAIGVIILNSLMFIHMIHMGKAFNKVMDAVRHLTIK